LFYIVILERVYVCLTHPTYPKVTYVPIYNPNIFFSIGQDSSETPCGPGEKFLDPPHYYVDGRRAYFPQLPLP
jgi:hypothetical protein